MAPTPICSFQTSFIRILEIHTYNKAVTKYLHKFMRGEKKMPKTSRKERKFANKPPKKNPVWFFVRPMSDV